MGPEFIDFKVFCYRWAFRPASSTPPPIRGSSPFCSRQVVKVPSPSRATRMAITATCTASERTLALDSSKVALANSPTSSIRASIVTSSPGNFRLARPSSTLISSSRASIRLSDSVCGAVMTVGSFVFPARSPKADAFYRLAFRSIHFSPIPGHVSRRHCGLSPELSTACRATSTRRPNRCIIVSLGPGNSQTPLGSNGPGAQHPASGPVGKSLTNQVECLRRAGVSYVDAFANGTKRTTHLRVGWSQAGASSSDETHGRTRRS